MNAITIDNEKRLLWTEVPDEELLPGHVRLDIHATALNRADLLQRQGRYPVPQGASAILGLEAAGVVSELGDGVDNEWLGARVCVLLEGGGYAEQVVVHSGMLLRIPDWMSFTDAACLPEAIYTVWTNIGFEAQIQKGETLLVNAAASGIGTMAIQIAKSLGCTVLGTASAGKLDTLHGLGIDACRERDLPELSKWVKEVNGGKAADVVFDMVGGPGLADHLDCLGHRGRLVLIGLMGGASTEINLGKLLMLRQRIIGSVLRSRSREEKLTLTAEIVEHVWPAVEAKKVQPVTDRIFDVREAEEAHALMASNATTGKIVLQVRA
jgi:putative PIG3 family NAD(P)H quinone oxidoreductase